MNVITHTCFIFKAKVDIAANDNHMSFHITYGKTNNSQSFVRKPLA